MHGLDIRIDRQGGTYTATLPLALKNGRTMMLRCSCTMKQAARELGYDPRTIGATFDPSDPEAWWRMVEQSEEEHEASTVSGLDLVERTVLLAAQPEVGGKIGRRIKRRFKKFGKKLGRAFRKFARSKVIRGILKFGKRIIKSPIFVGLASALTGGAAAAPLAAASAAVNIIDAARKGKGKHKKHARKLVKAALIADNQERAAKLGKLPAKVAKLPKIKSGPWEGVHATPAQEAQLNMLVRQVAKARLERKKAELLTPAPIRVTPQAMRGDVQRWMVELGGCVP